MPISMGRLMPLVESLRSRCARAGRRVDPRSTADADRHLKCPSCESPMDDHPYGGGGNINVDTCEQCWAVWLDRGELRRIASAPERRQL